MRLHTLKPRPGARHRVKRLGCGESSGHGKTSGKGHKGQKARSGGSIRLAFEGGQMPLMRRVPKRGFNNNEFKTFYAPVNVGSLNDFADGAEVGEKSLRAAGLVNGRWDGVKILGTGDLAKKLVVSACAFSSSAREKIEKAGGKAVVIPKAPKVTKVAKAEAAKAKAAK